jgi:predicted ABC-type transport system involved in lysophospholipase L1 biosynthesis ATPase subunit
LANGPAVVLADEPTGSLDHAAGTVVIEMLVRVSREHGAGVLLVTHDPSVGAVAERVVRMSDGHLESVSSA